MGPWSRSYQLSGQSRREAHLRARAKGGSAPRPRSPAMSGYQLRNRPDRNTRGGHTRDETTQSHETAQSALRFHPRSSVRSNTPLADTGGIPLHCTDGDRPWTPIVPCQRRRHTASSVTVHQRRFDLSTRPCALVHAAACSSAAPTHDTQGESVPPLSPVGNATHDCAGTPD